MADHDYEKSIATRRRLAQRAWERGDEAAVSAHEAAITDLNRRWRREPGETAMATAQRLRDEALAEGRAEGAEEWPWATGALTWHLADALITCEQLQARIRGLVEDK